MIKKIFFLFVIFFLGGILNAASFNNAQVIKISENDYIKSLPAVQQLLKKDIYYKKAIKFLTDKKKMLMTKETDPEEEETSMVYKINYDKVLDLFKKSVEKYKNPISAIKGYRIILLNPYFVSKKEKHYISIFAKTMYKYGLCEGYLAYGKIYEKGLYTRVNIKKALKIYESGKKICQRLNNWKFSEIMEKIFLLKKRLGKN